MGNQAPDVIHGLEEARAALEAAKASGQRVILTTEPQASAYMGAPFFKALIETATGLVPDALDYALYDCGNRAGDVLAALRCGLKDIAIDPAIHTEALVSLAEKHEARLHIAATFLSPRAPSRQLAFVMPAETELDGP